MSWIRMDRREDGTSILVMPSGREWSWPELQEAGLAPFAAEHEARRAICPARYDRFHPLRGHLMSGPLPLPPAPEAPTPGVVMPGATPAPPGAVPIPEAPAGLMLAVGLLALALLAVRPGAWR